MKKKFSYLIITLILVLSIFSFYFIPNISMAESTSQVSLKLTSSIDKNKLYVGEDLTVNLKLIPQGQINIERSPVSIVLVVDSSGSMSNNNKMSNAKSASKNFLNSMLNSAKIGDKIALIDFDTSVNDGGYYYSKRDSRYKVHTSDNSSDLLDINSTNITSLKNIIDNSMIASGGTNYEAAFLKAKEILNTSPTTNSKYVIFITDGMPTYYYDGTYNGYPLLAGDGYNSTTIVKNEAKSAALQLANNGVQIFMVGVDTENGAVDKNYIDEISAYTNGKSYYTSNPSSINDMLQEIQKIINKAVMFDNIGVEYTIPEGLTVTSMPSGWSVSNGKLVGSFNKVTFENQKGTPTSQEVSFKLKANSKGLYNLGNITLKAVRSEDGISDSNVQISCTLGQVEFLERPDITANLVFTDLDSIALPQKYYNLNLNINPFGTSLYTNTVISDFELVIDDSNIVLEKATTNNYLINYALNSGPNISSVTIPYRIKFNIVGRFDLHPKLKYKINGIDKILNLGSLNIIGLDINNLINKFSINNKVIPENTSAKITLQINDKGIFDSFDNSKIIVSVDMNPRDNINLSVPLPIEFVFDKNSKLVGNNIRTISKSVNFKLNGAKEALTNFKINNIKVIIDGQTYSTNSNDNINNVLIKKFYLR